MPRKIEVVEMPAALAESEACENLYGVSNRAWRKWNQQSRFIFNNVYHQMEFQKAITHPKTFLMPDEQWKTICWNAAWLAADAAWESVSVRESKGTDPYNQRPR